jgi:hypothetical protein
VFALAVFALAVFALAVLRAKKRDLWSVVASYKRKGLGLRLGIRLFSDPHL